MFTTSMAVHEIAICGGFYFSHPDIAGPFAGSVFGITNTMAQIPGFVNPMLVAYLTPNVSNLMIHQENWTLIVIKIVLCFHTYLCKVIHNYREHIKNGCRYFTLPRRSIFLDALHILS